MIHYRFKTTLCLAGLSLLIGLSLCGCGNPLKSGGASQPVAQPPYVPNPPQPLVTPTEEEGIEVSAEDSQAGLEDAGADTAPEEEGALDESDSSGSLAEDPDAEPERLSEKGLSDKDVERDLAPPSVRGTRAPVKTPAKTPVRQ